jgi:pantothenate synthetase
MVAKDWLLWLNRRVLAAAWLGETRLLDNVAV